MKSQHPESSMYKVFALVEEINRVSVRLIKIDAGVFRELSLPAPKFNPAELGFLRTVSWFYVLYNEAGKGNVEFISERLAGYGLSTTNTISIHSSTVQNMRTYLQHNLDPTEPRNRRIQECCEQWLLEKCGTPIPGNEKQWKKCLVSLLNDGVDYLNALLACIRKIEVDDSKEQILREWDYRRNRYHPPHEFDELIRMVAGDIGRDNIDAVRLRKRFHDKWSKELDLLEGNYDFALEARKLIEHVLLLETTPILPITGKDIINIFNIPPGPEVGQILNLARTLYDEKPCSRETLIEKIRQKKDGPNTKEPGIV